MVKLLPYILFPLGLLVTLILGPDAIDTLRISQGTHEFRSTRATVRSTRPKPGPLGTETYFVSYRYKVGRRTYDGTNHHTIDFDTESSVNALLRQEGTQKTILVYYDPKDPRTSVISKNVPWVPPAIKIISAGILLILGSGMLIKARKLSKFKRL